jgi:hypothetical protein
LIRPSGRAAGIHPNRYSSGLLGSGCPQMA